MAQLPIALQLYTVRDETARDFVGTLRNVAEIGYSAVEFAGYGGLPAGEVAALLKELGMQAASTHLGFAALDQRLDAELDFCQEIGCSSMVFAALPSEQRGEERVRALFDWFNDVGRRCRERGVTFAYHNHDFDFARSSDDHYLLDLLLENTDPALVSLECDAFWATIAGVDPVSYLQRWPGRVPLLHVKDMSSDRKFTEVGDGTMDMSAICRTAAAGGTRWYIVENDQPRIPSLESARRSLEYLNGLLPLLGIQ